MSHYESCTLTYSGTASMPDKGDGGSMPPLRQALEPALHTPYMSSFNNSLSIAKEVLIGSFQADGGRRSESLRILSDCTSLPLRTTHTDEPVAPSLMHPRIIAHTGAGSGSGSGSGPSGSRPLPRPGGRNSPHPLLRLPTTLPSSFAQLANRETSSSLAILEAVPALANLSLDTPLAGIQEEAPSLLRGFMATIPSSEIPKQRRRRIRGGLVDEDLGRGKIGLKKLGDKARGLLTDGGEDGSDAESLGVGRKMRKRRRDREMRKTSLGRQIEGRLHLEDLVKQADEIAKDKENLRVRTVSLTPSRVRSG